MATTKKPAASAAVKEVPAVSATPVAVKAVAPKPVAAAKKVAAKAVPKAAAAKTVAKPAAKKKAKTNSVGIDPGQRAKHIEVAASYIAERRGFAPGNPEQDYLDAASEIDDLIVAGHFGS